MKHINWREYQEQLKQEKVRPRFLGRGLRLILIMALVFVVGIKCVKVGFSTGSDIAGLSQPIAIREKGDIPSSVLTKQDIRLMLDPSNICSSKGKIVQAHYLDNNFTVVTTIDPDLQQYMIGEIEGSKSPMVGFVAMEPDTGRIIALVESKKPNTVKSVCLSSCFPAASIFKIVTAAATIEEHKDISASTIMTYTGGKYTLYKSQLSEKPVRYSQAIPLEKCFAQSINPVFGKLGIFKLGKGLLEEYAFRFGFNQPIDFELPVEKSNISVSDDAYRCAEIACGFNHETMISPLHGAMLCSIALNGGNLVEPMVVEQISDSNNSIRYTGNGRNIRSVVSTETSLELKKLMEATITSGTGRRTFRGYNQDPILSALSIGGKSGSINNENDTLRYDWFVGFSEERDSNNPKKLIVSVLVVHDSQLRTRSQQYAILAIKHYFGSAVLTSIKPASFTKS
ncbi:MAG: penicillin-binding transpeptidase domain-containing protein [Pseudomonadota bacterium]